ncbi:Intradiol ring-cleavage dioxygenase, partial [Lactarius vividus]
ITKLRDFVNETQVTLEGWVTIEFLTHIGQTCTPLHQEFILLSNVLGVPVLALVNALNNPPVSTGMESSILEPFFKVFPLGESSEGKGEYLYVEGHMHTTSSVPIPGAVIKMWETDDKGFYDTQYMDRVITDCCGWLVTDKDSRYGYRAILPI